MGIEIFHICPLRPERWIRGLPRCRVYFLVPFACRFLLCVVDYVEGGVPIGASMFCSSNKCYLFERVM